MEQLNRVELRGIVGAVKKTNIGEHTFTKFSVATNFIYKGTDGNPVIETTWHSVIYWYDIELAKGDKVEVVGRIRNIAYATATGEEKIASEIVAKNVNKVE